MNQYFASLVSSLSNTNNVNDNKANHVYITIIYDNAANGSSFTSNRRFGDSIATRTSTKSLLDDDDDPMPALRRIAKHPTRNTNNNNKQCRLSTQSIYQSSYVMETAMRRPNRMVDISPPPRRGMILESNSNDIYENVSISAMSLHDSMEKMETSRYLLSPQQQHEWRISPKLTSNPKMMMDIASSSSSSSLTSCKIQDHPNDNNLIGMLTRRSSGGGGSNSRKKQQQQQRRQRQERQTRSQQQQLQQHHSAMRPPKMPERRISRDFVDE